MGLARRKATIWPEPGNGQIQGSSAQTETKVQKVVDRLGSPPYRPVHRSGAALSTERNCHGRQQIRTAVPRSQIGEALLSACFVVWLFDIVGFR